MGAALPGVCYRSLFEAFRQVHFFEIDVIRELVAMFSEELSPRAMSNLVKRLISVRLLVVEMSKAYSKI
jgi:hypothetical protein